MVDTDLDARTNHCFATNQGTYSQCRNPSGLTPFRFYKVQDEFYRLEWEDSFPAVALSDGGAQFQADYNDYMVGWEFRDCMPDGQSPFPGSAQISANCTSSCGGPCNDSLLSEVNKHVKMSASVAIDRSASETPYEANGRLIQLSVNVYSDYLAGHPDLSKNIAICPVINLAWRSDPGPHGDVASTVQGLDRCMGAATSEPGMPSCATREYSRDFFPVAGSQQQMRATAHCGPWEATDETFRFQPATSCGPRLTGTLPMMRSILYEHRLDDIDSSLPPSHKYSSMLDEQLIAAVDSVDVYLYWGVPKSAIPFVCPSGPGIKPGDVAPGTFGGLFRYHIRRTALKVFQRGQ